MTVTEFAFLPLNGAEMTPDRMDIFDKGYKIRDGWWAQRYPADQKPRVDRAAAIFQQIEDPETILITANWDSPAQHGEWIASDENKGAMQKFESFLQEDFTKKVMLFYVEPVVFGTTTDGLRSLLDSPVISVGRMIMDAEKRAEFEAKFNQVRGALDTFAKPYAVKGGWRIQKADDSTEEFVLVCGWESVDKHMEFAKSESFAEYAQIRPFIKETIIKHYKRFM